MQWTNRIADLPAGRTPYLETGTHAAPNTLVLIHAFPVGVHMWEAQGAPAAWRFIAPALPGFDGAPEAPAGSTSIDDYARAVLAIMDLLHVPRAVVGGLSMGGYVAFAVWRLAAERCRALVLADTKAAAD